MGKRQSITYEIFAKILQGRSCLIDQITTVIFGNEKEKAKALEEGHEAPQEINIFKVAPKAKKFEHDYLFKRERLELAKDPKTGEYPDPMFTQEVHVIEDVSSGQRGYHRNVDALLAMMVQNDIDRDREIKEKIAKINKKKADQKNKEKQQ